MTHAGAFTLLVLVHPVYITLCCHTKPNWSRNRTPRPLIYRRVIKIVKLTHYLRGHWLLGSGSRGTLKNLTQFIQHLVYLNQQISTYERSGYCHIGWQTMCRGAFTIYTDLGAHNCTHRICLYFKGPGSLINAIIFSISFFQRHQFSTLFNLNQHLLPLISSSFLIITSNL